MELRSLGVWIWQIVQKKRIFFQRARSPRSEGVRSSPLDMFSRRRRTYGQLPNHILQEIGRNGYVCMYVYIYFCMALWIQIPANPRGVACSSIFYLLPEILKCNNPSFYMRATSVDFSGARDLRLQTKLFLPRDPLQSEILIINSVWFRVFG